MAFVKLDTGILDSTLWMEKDQRDVFLTALLMALPHEFKEPQRQTEIDTMEETGFVVPPGWYGYCRSAGIGILRRALTETGPGMAALRALGQPDLESRNTEFEGRRMIRVNGGFLILNYMFYRDRDYGAVTRSKNLRERKKIGIDAQIKRQNGRCDCCEAVFERPYSRGIVWDHNHKTGEPRGLVCPSCNVCIGLIEAGTKNGSYSRSFSSPKREICYAYLARYGVTSRSRDVVSHRNADLDTENGVTSHENGVTSHIAEAEAEEAKARRRKKQALLGQADLSAAGGETDPETGTIFPAGLSEGQYAWRVLEAASIPSGAPLLRRAAGNAIAMLARKLECPMPRAAVEMLAVVREAQVEGVLKWLEWFQNGGWMPFVLQAEGEP